MNSVFTIDRQQGVSLFGNLGEGISNISYWASLLTGTGRGELSNDDSDPMVMLRLQWNPNGEELGFTGSDLKFHESLVSFIALAAVSNSSPYTRFSTDGGGQLPDYESGQDGQYDINQWLLESAFKYRGWSWQQEAHYKRIDDTVNNQQTDLLGYYVQLGYIPHHLQEVPGKLEFYARQAWYDPDRDESGNNNWEYTVGMNWFFAGHRNKLTLEYSYLDFDRIEPDGASGSRVIFQ